MSPDHDRDPFPGLRVPRPHADLERRALDAAARALEEGKPSTVWDRLWGSVPLRVAWAGTTLALLLAHVALSLLPLASQRPDRPLRAQENEPEEVREVLSLPRFEISPRAERMALGGRRRPSSSS